jgi:hypothetical protein
MGRPFMGEKTPSPLSSLRFGRLGRNAKHKLLLARDVAVTIKNER